MIELDLGCRLGLGVEVTRPGIGQVPQRGTTGGRERDTLYIAASISLYRIVLRTCGVQ